MLTALAWLLLIAGGIVYLVGFIAILRALFEESILYCGLGFVFPIVAWIYALLHFKEMNSEFWCLTAGTITVWAGIAMLNLGPA